MSVLLASRINLNINPNHTTQMAEETKNIKFVQLTNTFLLHKVDRNGDPVTGEHDMLESNRVYVTKLAEVVGGLT
ncbi:hypothetical protein V1478_009982 [Vespula squamosa]|uniref:Uncharacterized protein n=1 Tax=Vespula squamosa TaxID=30214 RepID=A0ABD2AKJ8_VESSQ